MNLLKSLTTAEKKKIKQAVEAELEKYQLLITTEFYDREARITTSPEPRYHGPTNQTSDQTAAASVYNVDKKQERSAFCERVEQAINQLPEKERFLIEKRYTSLDSQYMTDMRMYCFEFDPPMSAPTYDTIRISAMLKIALSLRLDCVLHLIPVMTSDREHQNNRYKLRGSSKWD